MDGYMDGYPGSALLRVHGPTRLPGPVPYPNVPVLALYTRPGPVLPLVSPTPPLTSMRGS